MCLVLGVDLRCKIFWRRLREGEMGRGEEKRKEREMCGVWVGG